jgi:hypothetical protein
MRKIYYTIDDEGQKEKSYKTEDYKFNGTKYILFQSTDVSNSEYVLKTEYKYDSNNINIIETQDCKKYTLILKEITDDIRKR